ncbi:HEPN domain-containing protein [Neolewinella agarilytica]|uniref:ApeA N-terminal domain 1-containing protein n=1 Tax=Neolewinella agarilytica TaxID=478744 RepID=UPI002352EC5D|nr:HEPN domain-containing protein [Neolewinella agarilytica]
MKKRYSLNEAFKSECKVILDNKGYYGILSFDSEVGCGLSILGGIGIRNRGSLEIIRGFLSTGEEFVLYKCIRINFDYFNAPRGFAVDKFQGTILMIGEEINEDLKFKRITFSTTNSKEFFYESNIEFGQLGDKYKFEVSKLVPIKIVPNNNRKIDILRVPKMSASNLEGLQAKQICNIQITSKSRINFLSLLYDLQAVKNSTDLITQSPSNIEFVKLDKVRMLYKPKSMLENIKAGSIPMTRYREVKDIYRSYLSKFFNSNKEINRSMVEYFSVIHHVNRYGSDNYLSLCRSMEAFHRCTVKPKMSFKQRVADLLKKYCYGCLLYLKITNINVFSKAVDKYRNSLTHANVGPFDDVKKNREIYVLQIQLEAVFSIILLRYFGLPKEMVFEKIGQTFIP